VECHADKLKKRSENLKRSLTTLAYLQKRPMKLKRSLLTPQKKPTNSYETHKEPTDTRIPTSIPSKETCETQKKPTNSFLTVFFRVDATRHGFTPFRV